MVTRWELTSRDRIAMRQTEERWSAVRDDTTSCKQKVVARTPFNQVNHLDGSDT